MNAPCDEPTTPRGLRRPLAAVWISFGLHAALIALVQVAVPGNQGGGGTVIEARMQHVAGGPPVQPAAAGWPLAPADAHPARPAVEAAPDVPPAEPLAAIGSPVDLTYYTTREVDVPPQALRDIVPDYPQAAVRQALPGRVRLQLKLEVDGRVSDVEVIGADPPGLFDASARAAFAAARFSPAYRGGKPVRVQMTIEVAYALEPESEPE